ncbi:MAG: hypothetical protein IKW35_04270 [Paludibacteraceae bacterium]|nr:hypothetical protein [Paludibacteraceae bacterium]
MESFELLPSLFEGRIFGKHKWFTDEHSAELVMKSPWNYLTNSEFRIIADVTRDYNLRVTITTSKEYLMIHFS